MQIEERVRQLREVFLAGVPPKLLLLQPARVFRRGPDEFRAPQGIADVVLDVPLGDLRVRCPRSPHRVRGRCPQGRCGYAGPEAHTPVPCQFPRQLLSRPPVSVARLFSMEQTTFEVLPHPRFRGDWLLTPNRDSPFGLWSGPRARRELR
jgi:hypothetical protein